MNTVYSVGYSLGGAEEHVETLVNQGALLIDTRLSPKSWRAGWQKADLERKYKDKYHWAGNYLGNVNYNNDKPITLKNPAVGIRGLMTYLREEYDLILLCQCPDYESCHRKVIADLLLQQAPEVQIEVYSPTLVKKLHTVPGLVQTVFDEARLEQRTLLDVPEERHFDEKRTKVRRRV